MFDSLIYARFLIIISEKLAKRVPVTEYTKHLGEVIHALTFKTIRGRPKPIR